MTEGTPKHIKETAAWAIDRISQRMQQEPVPLDRGNMHGVGYKAQDPENLHDQRYAALFPNERVVRIGAPNLDVRIRNASVQPAADGLEVRANDGSLRALFLRDGHIAIEVFPIPSLAVTEAALTDESEPIRESSSPSPDDVPGASSGEIAVSPPSSRKPGTKTTAPRHDGEQTIEGAKAALQEHESNRVKNLRGRVATDPNMEPTPQGKPRVQFVLAEHIESEGDAQTVWHHVYTLNKQAESLKRRGLAKGQKVGIDGYRQQRTRKRKDGAEEHQAVIYANVVRTIGRGERMEAAEATGKEPQ